MGFCKDGAAMKLRAVESPSARRQGADWFTPARFAMVLGALLLACFPQVFLGLETFAAGDMGQFAYPVAAYLRDSYWKGEMPLWNPLNSCGMPFLAQWNTMALYPPSILYILMPLSWGLGVFCLLHLFWAGLAMYFLAARWTSSRLAAAVAGTVFAFNGFTWYGVVWPHLLAALAWMPLVVLACDRAWHGGRRQLAWAALAGAMQMLSGGTEVILFTWLVIAVLGLGTLLAGEGIESGLKWRVRWRLTLRFVVIVVWVAGLAAAQLLPFLDLNLHSQRTAYYGQSAVSAVSPMPLWGWASYLVPLFHCLPRGDGICMQPGQGWLASYYLGVGVVALAFVGLWLARQWRVWVLAAVGLAGLLLAFGDAGGVYSAVKAVAPGIRLIRFPIKFVLLATFVLPLLAAYGVAGLSALPQERGEQGRRLLLRLGAALGVAIGVIVGLGYLFPLRPGESGEVAVNGAVRVLFLALGLGVVGLLLKKNEARTAVFLQAGLLTVLWFDVFTHAPNLSPTLPLSVWDPNLVREAAPWNPALLAGETRAMVSPETMWKLLETSSGNLKLDVTAWRMALFMNANLVERVPKVDGFFSSDLRDYYDVFGRLYFKTNRQERLKDFLGVSQISQLGAGVEWKPRPTAMPIVTCGQRPVFCSGEQALERVTSDAFEPSATVLLPLETQAAIKANGMAKARIISSKQAAHRVEIEVEAEAAAVVVIAQTYSHCWQAAVDGDAVPLWRANHAFQAVEVGAGKHRVVLEYHDRAFRWGTGISLVSLLFCGICLLGKQKVPV
jgi:hypothetical protein